ncbi:MAG: 50S ribosomal protein L6 [bacterium]|nr:50S ribosomal protein L6 [bacterium]
MSRVGKYPVQIPDKVRVTIDQNKVRIEGPKGMIEREFPPQIEVAVEGKTIKVSQKGDVKNQKSIHGTTRAIINNMVTGVTQGHGRTLLIEGQGYRAKLDGKNLSLQLGYATPIQFTPPKGVEIEVPRPEMIVIRGIDKQLVGDVAARIRAIKSPEPYKGKGIRYEREYVRKKTGKKAVV